MALFPFSSKLGSLVCTMGLLTGNIWLGSGRLPAIAHAPSAIAHASLTAPPTLPQGELDHIFNGTLNRNTDRLVASAQHLGHRANRRANRPTPPPPNPWGEPYTGTGTSTDARGSCPGVNAPLVALMPDVNHGRSLSDDPTLWFYVPYDSATISHGKFLLQDEEHNNVILPREFTLSNTPGFVSVSVPAPEHPLMEDKPYHWFFELYCQGNPTSPVHVDGWIEKTSIERSPLPIESSPSPDVSSDFELYPLYLQNFIWFDAVDAIIQEWGEMPNEELAEELLSLLQSANVSIEEWPTDAPLTPVRYD